MKSLTLLLGLWFTAATFSIAQKGTEADLIKEANQHFQKEEFLKAYPLFSQLVSLYPQHPEYNYKFGVCALHSQPDKSQAIKHLLYATNKGVTDPMAWYYLGKAYHLNYEFKEAMTAYRAYEDKSASAKQKLSVNRELEMCNYGTGLLANMKEVIVLNKVESDKQNFFRYFNLEEIGGRILTVPAELRTKLDEKSKTPGVIHYPGNSTTIYFASYGKEGSSGKDIYRAQILPDGKFSTPELLKGGVNTRYDEDYCFMASDGRTLYFSSKGHNSMGGYDIFKSIYDPATDSFGPAINLDFAINTPDDDIFYVSDAQNKRAYFASGRTSDMDHMHVYNVMVESQPVEIIYLKGDFSSEINPELKNARISVKEATTDRPVFDSQSNSTTGKYLLFIPKAGSYNFMVSTDNSPLVHKALVQVPHFDRPVALRQEMTLVKEGGIEKLVVKNYFESPLDEDLSALAAEVLRKKADLDVNANDAVIKQIEEPQMQEFVMERSLENAPLAAGFAEGISIDNVMADMKAESAKIQAFVSEAGRKSDISLAYAAKKQIEAEDLLKRSEQIRANTSTYMSTDDVSRLRESHNLALEAAKLHQEASSALVAAAYMKQYGQSENERAAALENNLAELQNARNAGNFDQVLNALKTEKDRQAAVRGGQVNTPMVDILAKAKATESQQKAATERLENLRAEEVKLGNQLKAAEQNLQAAKKKNEKEKYETEYANLKASLDNKRRQISSEGIKVETLGRQLKAQQSDAEYFARLQTDTRNMGLASNETTPPGETEQRTLAMKLSDMSNRLEALEIHDTQMLALLGEPVESNTTALARPEDPRMTQIRSERQKSLSKLSDNDPAAAPAKRMLTEAALQDTDNKIAGLETSGSQLSPEDKVYLEQLKAYRAEINKDLAIQAPPRMLTPEERRVLYASVKPDYGDELTRINNLPTTELNRQHSLNKLNLAVLASLIAEKNATSYDILSAADPKETARLAERNERLRAAIDELENNTQDVGQYRTAYELENKSIIESNNSYMDKLEDQIALTEDYMEMLRTEESATKEAIAAEQNPERKKKQQQRLEAISREQDIAVAKLDNYRSDLKLTTAASASTSADPNTNPSKSNKLTRLEDQLEMDVLPFAEPSSSVEEAKPAEEDDGKKIQKLFVRPVTEESIVAYETGALDEIAARQQTTALQLKNRDKIAAIQDEIFLIEAEIENETNVAKQKKLDRDAEKLYLKKSLLEIENARAIAEMTQLDFEQHQKSVEALMRANKEKTDSRIIVRDELKTLYNKAKDEMEDAAILRKKGWSVVDDIEKNDFFRRAFAKEVAAIRMLENMQAIYDNLDMLMKYSDQELTALRFGKAIPKDESKLQTADASSATETGVAPVAAASFDFAQSTLSAQPVATARDFQKDASNIAASIPGNMNPVALAGTEQFVAYRDQSNAALEADNRRLSQTEQRNQLWNQAQANEARIAELEQQKAAATSQEQKDRIQEQINVLRTENNTAYSTISAMDKSIAADKAKAEKYQSEADAMYAAMMKNGVSNDTRVAEATNRSAVTPMLPDTPAPIANSGSTVAGSTNAANSNTNIANRPSNTNNNSSAVAAGNNNNRSTTTNAGNTGSTGNSNWAATSGYVSESGARSASAGNAGAYAYSEAEKMFFMWPASLDKDLFVLTNHSVYSEYKPIPVDAAMPAGVYYKIQVGAFRNHIPQNLYDDFAPVAGESLTNGITRYTAGFFLNYQNADVAKKLIRTMGYSDAFVVAYRNGKRIPLYEAMGQTEGDNFMTHVEKEYVHGDNAPKKAVEEKSVAGFTIEEVKNHFSKYPNSAKAIMVETITGLFYTVQVGVYSKPVTLADLFYINPLNSELNEKKQVRYTSGIFNDLNAAVDKRTEARAMGVKDAFVTAYYNGKRISLTEADNLIKQYGPEIFARMK